MEGPTLEDQFRELVIATVPATRKTRRETPEDRRKRKKLQENLEDKAADIVAPRVGTIADEPDEARVSDVVAKKLRQHYMDGGQGALLRYQNLVSRLQQEPHTYQRTTSMIDFLSRLSFSGSPSDRVLSSASTSNAPSSRIASRTSMLDIPSTSTEPGRPSEYLLKADTGRSGSLTERNLNLTKEREGETNWRSEGTRADSGSKPSRNVSAGPPQKGLRDSVDPSRKDKQPARGTVRSSSPLRIRGFELQDGERVPRRLLLERLRSRAGKPELQEVEILRDMMYVLQGIDGKWIRLEEIREPPQPGQDEATKVVRVRFEGSEESTISPKRRETIRLLAELGILHRRISSFSEERMRLPGVGRIMQSLCIFINSELTDYYRLIATLETQLSQAKLASNGAEDSAAEQAKDTTLTLKRTAAWTAEAVLKTRLLSSIIEFGQDSHGGKLISLIHEFTHNGDPFIHKFATRVLQEVSKPFFHALTRWIYEGELEDPLQEFFVELTDPSLIVSSAPHAPRAGLDMDALSLWQSKFAFREEMLPSFVGVAFARKIFSTGKSLNFIRYSLGDSDWIATRNRLSHAGGDLRYVDIAGLEQTIDATHKIASQHLLDIFLDKFKLLAHLRALKDYMLLAKGDFVDSLITALSSSLSLPAKSLFRHNLTASIETAIRESNAKFDDPDVVRRIDAHIRPAQEGDTGWETFSLGYQVDSPVNLVLDSGAMEGYQTIFLHLWRMKRVEVALGKSWSRLSLVSNVLSRIAKSERTDKTRYLDGLTAQTLRSLGEEIHFVRQSQGFCQLEVIDYSWHDLQSFFAKRQGDLDELVESHRAYLNALIGKVLLRGGRRGTSPDHLAKEMQLHMETMLAYSSAADDLSHYVEGVLAQRQMAVQSATFTGPSSSLSVANLKKITNRLDEHLHAFQERTNAILSHLRVHPNLVVRDLAVRLNYNNFYNTGRRRAEAVEGEGDARRSDR